MDCGRQRSHWKTGHCNGVRPVRARHVLARAWGLAGAVAWGIVTHGVVEAAVAPAPGSPRKVSPSRPGDPSGVGRVWIGMTRPLRAAPRAPQWWPSGTQSLSEVRDHFSEVVDRVEHEHDRVTVTRNGRPAAVILSPDDLAQLEETLEILSDPEAQTDIREADAAYRSGDVVRGGSAARSLRRDPAGRSVHPTAAARDRCERGHRVSDGRLRANPRRVGDRFTAIWPGSTRAPRHLPESCIESARAPRSSRAPDRPPTPTSTAAPDPGPTSTRTRAATIVALAQGPAETV